MLSFGSPISARGTPLLPLSCPSVDAVSPVPLRWPSLPSRSSNRKCITPAAACADDSDSTNAAVGGDGCGGVRPRRGVAFAGDAQIVASSRSTASQPFAMMPFRCRIAESHYKSHRMQHSDPSNAIIVKQKPPRGVNRTRETNRGVLANAVSLTLHVSA